MKLQKTAPEGDEPPDRWQVWNVFLAVLTVVLVLLWVLRQ